MQKQQRLRTRLQDHVPFVTNTRPASAGSRPLRIGYLNQDFLPEVGAGPARLLEMSRRWQTLGAEVTIITGMPNRRIPGRGEGSVDPRYAGKWFIEEQWEGIRTLRSWVFTGNGRGFKNKLVNMASFMMSGVIHTWARREKFDIIIASSPPFPAHVSGVALAATGTPLVLEIRDLWPDYMVEMGMLKSERSQRALFGLEKWLLKRAKHVVVVTESFRERVVTKGVPRECTDVISNGVDLDQYGPSEEASPIPGMANGVRRAASGDNSEFYVGYLGTMGKGQDIPAVVRAAALVEKVDPSVKFFLVGDGPEKPLVEAEIARTGVKNVVIQPPIQRTQTRAFYNACDLHLVPLAALKIFNETVPSKMFEIMACERPLVAGLAGEGAAIVNASGGGIIAEPGNPQALADAILKVKAMPEAQRRAMGAKGRAYVSRNYSRTALADRYFGILTALAKGQTPPGR